MWYKITQILNLFFWILIYFLFSKLNLPVGIYYAPLIFIVIAALFFNEIFREQLSVLKYILAIVTVAGYLILLFILAQIFPVYWTRFEVLNLSLVGFLCTYTVVYILFKAPESIGQSVAPVEIPKKAAVAKAKILDTSAIIDGRIADMCETKFIEGVFIVPKFVIQELQHIADSSDMVKRAKGRRGLDILKEMQKSRNVMVEISDTDFPHIKAVDHKLLQLAKDHEAAIVTNDYNLNKTAQIQDITVLNINELANCVKTKMIPGEERKVAILKSGKDHNQGLAYLEDGTMIVVENGRNKIGKTVNVIVTSVLQTSAGRMIFAKIK